MAIGRLLKVSALLGGGVLVIGGGAVGAYFAQPFLESKLHPERKQNEEKLKQAFDSKSEEVETLGRDLNKVEKSNKHQNSSIAVLTKQIGGLNLQIKDKEQQISQKDKDIEEKNQKIQEQNSLNESQKQTLEQLDGQVKQKELEINIEKASKDAIQKNLERIKKRLSLTRENILTEKTLKLSSTKVDVRKIELKEIGTEGISTFEVIDYSGTKRTIKIKKNRLPNHEQKALEIKKQGITFGLDDSFKQWSKKIKVIRYDIHYDYHPTDEACKNNFTINDTETVIDLTEYFKPGYLEEAFKVLVAIGHLQNPFLQHNISDSSTYLFRENADITQVFVNNGESFSWPSFKATEESGDKFTVWVNRFVTVNDLINYWTRKTVEFTRTGTVDFFDFLNPLLLSKNYHAV